ncbi:MAG: DUF3387 domain-containing protein [Dehalococcoidia bacterium]|nr:DUF3387 domain-containing protein [Dehalococcoidia bacterium]
MAQIDDQIATYLQAIEIEGKTVKTIASYANSLAAFRGVGARLGFPDGVSDYEVAHVYAFLGDLRARGASAGYQHRRHREVKTCFSWFKRMGLVQENVFARVPLVKRPQLIKPPFAPEEVQRLLDGQERSTAGGSRNYALILFLLDTGVRASECIALELADIDWERSRAFVRHGKGEKQRWVGFGARTADVLREYFVQFRGEAPGAFFLTSTGRPMTAAGTLEVLLRRLGARANEFRGPCAAIGIVAAKIRSLQPRPDISEIMDDVEALLDSSVATEDYVIRNDPPIDLSQIDFDALAARFQSGRRHTDAERLRSAVERKLERMIELNHSRLDFKEKFQALIDDYNSGAANVEAFFRELMEFAKALDEEQKRTISEQLSDEELALFDLLTRPEITLTKSERDRVKKAARELLFSLKAERLVLDWRKRQQSRAAVMVTIENVFDRELPEPFTPDLFRGKCELVYQHVYDSYFGEGRGTYGAA